MRDSASPIKDYLDMTQYQLHHGRKTSIEAKANFSGSFGILETIMHTVKQSLHFAVTHLGVSFLLIYIMYILFSF